MKDTVPIFNNNSLVYDGWFDTHPAVYQSELLAIKPFIPKNKTGIEIGAGTGRFAQQFNIKYGVEPSENMAKIAEQRGITVYRAFAEDLPFGDSTFDFVMMVTTVCFLSDISEAFSETRRILKTNGEIILAVIDKNSEPGKMYLKENAKNKFYSNATFYSPEELTLILQNSGFSDFMFRQTLTNINLNEVQKPATGYGKGCFVVIKANKNNIKK